MFHYFHLIYYYFNKLRRDNNVIHMQIAFSYRVSNYDVKEHFLYLRCSTFTQSRSSIPFSEQRKLDRVLLFLLSFRNICSQAYTFHLPVFTGFRILFVINELEGNDITVITGDLSRGKKRQQ